MSTVHPLFTALADDAALFPPASTELPDAVARHPRHHAASYGGIVGRFLCPASRLGDLIAALAGDAQLVLGLIADTGIAGLGAALQTIAADDRLDIQVLEIPVPAGAQLLASVEETLLALPPLMTFVELPGAGPWQESLRRVGAAGRGAKLRTGGARAALFPSTGEVAGFIIACAAGDVPFKCTAGLHRAVRHTDPDTGFDHHGFLNIALATHVAVLGGDTAAVQEVLAERDPDRLARAFTHVTDHDARRARALFVSFGTCSITDPVEDLTAMGLLQ